MEKDNMTAVEWLIEQLVELDKQLDGRRKSDDSTVMKLNPVKIFKQAKLMEEQNIRMAWTDGHALGRNGLVVVDYSNSKEYYDKYYKK